MAVQTIYILTAAAVTPNWYGRTQLNGTAPSQTNTAYGWTPGKIAVTTPYYRGRLGASTNATVAQAASWNASTSGPTPGTGATATTAGDSYVAGPFSGVFAATVWTFNWNLRASTAGCVGNINMRVWKSANADGSAATQLMANTAGAVVTLSTTLATNSQITWSPGALTLNNEYLFFQLEWQETVAGTSNTNTVAFLAGQTLITTPDLTTGITGTLAITQAAQTVSAAGNSVVLGALSLAELSDTLAAAGAPRVSGALTLTELSDALAATGAVLVPLTATLSITETPDTVAAAGGPVVSGFVGGGAPWTPANLGANLSAWFDASDVATITVAGSGVSQWLDKSSYSRHVIQPNDAQRPAYATGRVGLLDNTALYCSGPQFPTGNHDYIFAGKAIGAAKYHTLLLSGGGQHINFITDLSDNCGVWVSSFFQVGGLNWPPGTDALIYGSISNTSTAAMAKNGGALTTASVGTFDCTLLTLGQASYPQGFGDLYEFVMVPYSTATDIRQSLEGYVAWKWNLASLLPADHPYKTFAPSSGPGALPQANQTIAATGTVATPSIGGTLAVIQAPQTVAAASTVTVRGTLTAPQASQTIVAAAGLPITGTLSQSQAAQTIVATGGARVGGTLTALQTNQTIVAAGGPRVGAALSALQTNETLVAAGTIQVGGTLTTQQASQTISATGSVVAGIGGSLALTQAPQTIAAAAGSIVIGRLSGSTPSVSYFDPATTYTSTIVLSNNNLTVTRIGSPSYDNTISTTTLGATKVYTEIHLNQHTNDGRNAVGIALKTAPIHLSWLGDTALAYGWFGDANLYHSGTTVAGGTMPTYATGHWIGIAVDRVAKTVQFRNITTASAWSTAYSIADFGNNDVGVAATLQATTQSITANFNGTWLGAPPSVDYTRWAPPIVSDGATQDNQTLSALAYGAALGNLSVFQAAQTLAAQGRVAVAGTLARTQADHTIVAFGGPRIGAVLALIEDSQIVVATGRVVIAGRLTETEAVDTLTASGISGAVVQTRVLMLA